MRKLILPVLLLFAVSAFVSCGESDKEKAQRKLIDSLETANAQGKMEYDDLKDYLNVIADGLDSISIEENELLVSGNGEIKTRQEIKQNLNHVREILNRHRDRIAELEKKLEASDKNMAELRSLRTIVASLRKQLDAKDEELAQLRADLDDSRRSIGDLTSRVQQMTEEKEELDRTIVDQQETIAKQQNQMNVGYIRIASKKELKNEGLLSGGFLKKSKVDYSNIDLSNFQTVDIRTVKQIDVPKKSKILTAVPDGSYYIDKNGSGDVIRIVDPARFWSVSNILIIQTN